MKRADESNRHFQSITENGMDFVESAIDQLWKKGNRNIKYSTINFYTGVELILKARLLNEHWTTIVSNPAKADMLKFESGDFVSVGLDETIERLNNIVGTPVPQQAKSAFDRLRKHRNRMMHFYHQQIIGSNLDQEERSDLVKEQLQSWFYIRRLMCEQWKEVFLPFESQIDRLNIKMKKHSEYLHVVWEQVRSDIEKFEQTEHPAGLCQACGYNAVTVFEDGPQVAECRVCAKESNVVRWTCSSCGRPHLINFDGGTVTICPWCEEDVHIEDVLQKFSHEGALREKDFHTEGGYSYCSYCESIPTSVGTTGSGIFCFSCLEWHQELGDCKYCGEKWAGLEDSRIFGCPHCGGGLPKD